MWLSDLATSSEESVDDEHIGMMEQSASAAVFLSLPQAGPHLRDRIAFVCSSLRRTRRPAPSPRGAVHRNRGRFQRASFASKPAPAGPGSSRSTVVQRRWFDRLHDYGVAIATARRRRRTSWAGRTARGTARQAVRRSLLASALERVDKQRSDDEFAAVRTLARHAARACRQLCCAT